VIFKKIRLILLKILGRKNYEKIIFFLKNRYVSDLDSPKTFNEIVASRKVSVSHSQLQSECSDKLKVRDYVEKKIGSEYLTDLYDIIYIGGKISPIGWPKKVVLKANHASGKRFIKILDDVSRVNQVELQKWANQALKSNYGIITNEFWYNDISPRAILVEERLNPDGSDLKDYKFMIVNGEILFIQVDQGRFTNHTRNLYSEQWESLDFTFGYPFGKLVDEPQNLGLMIEISKKLSSDFDLCRIDLYEDQFGRVKFGEITFSPDAGWGRFVPQEYDFKLGSKLKANL
jgi:hypothetical protein